MEPKFEIKGGGGDLVVIALAYCSEDLSLNHAGYLIFLLLYVKTKMIEKEAGLGPLKETCIPLGFL